MTAAQQALIELENVTWPITWRYHLRAPWGRTQMQLTVNAPSAASKPAMSVALGAELWRLIVAPATSSHLELLLTDTYCWRIPGGFVIDPGPTGTGLLTGAVATREDSAVLVMHTLPKDKLHKRRLCLPGIRADWVMGGMLSYGALGALEALAQACVMGMCAHLTGAPLAWLIAYPDRLPPTPTNPRGVGFRRVEYVSVCQYTRPAPEQSLAPWP